VALTEALTVKKNLCKIALSNDAFCDHVQNKPTLGVQACDALNAMVRVSTSLLMLLHPFETDGVNERLIESR
jgi:hypothetical protein